MTDSEQPVNCPLCKTVTITRTWENEVDGLLFVSCDNSKCEMHNVTIPLKDWNKAFGPRDIDWSNEREKFNEWFNREPVHKGVLHSEGSWIWYGWKAALENRDK